MIVRNEQASSVYTTELIADIIKENAKSRFETRTAVPGHVQQGYTPSAADRVYAVQFSLKAIEFLEQYNRCVDNADIIMDKEDNDDDNDDEEEGYDIDFSPKHSQVVIGIQGAALQFTSVKKLYDFEADVKLRKGKTVHWKNIIEVEDMLSGKSLLKRNERG